MGAHSLGNCGVISHALTPGCLATKAVVDTSLGRLRYPISRVRGSSAPALPAQQGCHHR